MAGGLAGLSFFIKRPWRQARPGWTLRLAGLSFFIKRP